jgi:hypothetical protein
LAVEVCYKETWKGKEGRGSWELAVDEVHTLSNEAAPLLANLDSNILLEILGSTCDHNVAFTSRE